MQQGYIPQASLHVAQGAVFCLSFEGKGNDFKRLRRLLYTPPLENLLRGKQFAHFVLGSDSNWKNSAVGTKFIEVNFDYGRSPRIAVYEANPARCAAHAVDTSDDLHFP